MSLQSAYDDILEDLVCKNCGAVGMESDGGLDYFCPVCGQEGTLEDEEDEEDEEDD